MAVESGRGCGFREVGKLYIVGDPGEPFACHKLPYPLHDCPTCGHGIKHSRGWTFIDPREYFEVGDCPLLVKDDQSNACKMSDFAYAMCPFRMEDKVAILWVGDRYYSPESFVAEAIEKGFSRAIPFIPKELEIGKTWIFFAHKTACPPDEHSDGKDRPGVFYAARPRRIELPIWESELTPDVRKKLEKRGITPIAIPDGDEDHAPGQGRRKRNWVQYLTDDEKTNGSSLDDYGTKVIDNPDRTHPCDRKGCSRRRGGKCRLVSITHQNGECADFRKPKPRNRTMK